MAIFFRCILMDVQEMEFIFKILQQKGITEFEWGVYEISL